MQFLPAEQVFPLENHFRKLQWYLVSWKKQSACPDRSGATAFTLIFLSTSEEASEHVNETIAPLLAA